MPGKRQIQLVCILLICLVCISSCNRTETIKPISPSKIKDPISLEITELVVNTFFEEVIKKDEINRIDLVAKKEKAPLFTDFFILVDGVRYPLKTTIAGYHPKLVLTDLDDDGLSDFIVTVNSGNSDNSLFFELFHFQNREFLPLFSNNQEKGIVNLHFSWFSKNVLQIQSQAYKINSKKTINLPNQSFISSQIGMSGYIKLNPEDIDKDGQSELITMQTIWLKFPHHVIFNFHTILKYTVNQWTLLEYRLVPVSRDLTNDHP